MIISGYSKRQYPCRLAPIRPDQCRCFCGGSGSGILRRAGWADFCSRKPEPEKVRGDLTIAAASGYQLWPGQVVIIGGLLNLGEFMEAAPEILQEFEELHEFGVAGGFLNESVCAQLASTGDVGRVGGGREDNDDHAQELRLGSYPGKEFKAVHARHSKIQQQELRHGEFCAVGIPALSLNVVDRLRPDFTEWKPAEKPASGAAKLASWMSLSSSST